MAFRLDAFVLEEDLVSLAGVVELPAALGGTLANRPLAIRDFTISTGGTVRSFMVELSETGTLPFCQVWSLSFNNLLIRYLESQPWILFNTVSLNFPSGYGVQNALVEQVRFNPLTGDFDFAAMEFNTNILLIHGGIDFTLTKLAINQERTFRFSGIGRFPNQGITDLIAGKTFNVEALEIRRDGSLGQISARMGGIEGRIFPGWEGLAVRNGELSLEKNREARDERSIIISLAGELLLSSGMPGTLMNNRLIIERMIIDASVPAITQFKARGPYRT